MQVYSGNQDFCQMIILSILIFIVMNLVLGSKFSAASNFSTMLAQMPQYGMFTMSVAISMLLGGFDLSTVSLANLATVVATQIMIGAVTEDMPNANVVTVIVISIVCALCIGVLGGILNGVVISIFHVPAMLATLGTGQIFKGIAIVITKGSSISGLPVMFSRIGSHKVLGFVPLVFIVFIVCVLILIWITRRTRFGKEICLIGSNKVTAYYSGIKVRITTIKAYTLCGLYSALGGLIMLAKNNSAKADYGDAYTLMCVMIAILGGVSPAGGYGRIGAVAIAIFAVQMISSAITMLPALNNHFTKLLWGGILIVVMLIRQMQLNKSK